MKLKVFLSPLISKIDIVKLKLSIIVKRIIPITLAVTLGFSVPVFADTPDVTQSWLAGQFQQYLRTNQVYYWKATNGNNTTISRYSNLIDVLAQFAGNNSEHLYAISQKLHDYTSYLDGLEGYVDGLENAFGTNNTRLQSILTAIQGITTYNYTSVLNSILSNTNYIPTIESDLQVTNDALGDSDTGIWGATAGIAYNTGLISTDTSSILSQISSFASFDSRFVSARVNNSVTGDVSWSNVNNSNMPRVASRNVFGTVISGLSGTRTLGDFVSAINSNLLQTLSVIYTPYTQYSYRTMVTSNGTTGRYNALSVADILQSVSDNVATLGSKMIYLYADDDTIAQKMANKDKNNQVMNDFTGSGSASASLDDFTAMKDAGASVKAGLTTNVAPTSVLGVFDNEDGFGWFSQATLNSLDSTSSSNRLFKSANSGYDTPLYDDKLDEIFSIMGVKHD